MAGNRVGIDIGAKDNASTKLDKIRNKFAKLQEEGAKGLAIGVGAKATEMALGLVSSALGRVTNYLGDSVQAASDQAETFQKADVIFGRYTGTVREFGRTAATAFGISEEGAVAAAAQFGNLLDTAGVTGQATADMSVKLVELAADLASFNNIDPTEALDKLQSGLVGQAKPLRELGILLSEAEVDAKAMALGFQKVNGEFTQGQKVQARYALIFEQSTRAQGDFERTSGGLANQQRILRAQLDNVSSAIGERLLPVVLKLAQTLNWALSSVDQFSAGLEAMNGPSVLGQASTGIKQLGEVLSWVGDRIDEVRGGPLERFNESMAQTPGIVIGARDDWRKAAGASFGVIADEAEEAKEDTKKAVADTMRQVADKIRQGRRAIVDAMQTVIDDTYDPLIIAGRIAAVEAELSSKDLREGLRSKDPEIKADAELRRLELQKQLAGLVADQSQYGDAAARMAFLKAQLTSDELIAGLNSKDEARRLAAQHATEDIVNELIKLAGGARRYGTNTGNAYADGLIQSLKDKVAEAKRAVGLYKNILVASSPPGPESPLHFIDKWGERTGAAWAEGLESGLAKAGVASAMGPVVAGLSGGGGLRGGMLGGSPLVALHIDNFYGTEQNVRELSRSLGAELRFQRARRN